MGLGRAQLLRWLVVGLIVWACPSSLLSDDNICRRYLGQFGELSELPQPLTSFDALIAEHLRSEFVSPVQIRRYRAAYFGTDDSQERLAVTADFAVVRQLNRLLGSKSRTAALFSLYKKLFFDNLKRDAFLWHALVKTDDGMPFAYADYSRIGLIFRREGALDNGFATLRSRLNRLLEKTNREFFGLTRGIAELSGIEGDGPNLVHNRRSWVTMGTGPTPLQATVAARLARFQNHTPHEVMPTVDFRSEHAQRLLLEQFETASHNRLLLQRELEEFSRIAGVTGLSRLSSYPSGHASLAVPSERLLGLLRDVNTTSEGQYQQVVRERIQSEFQTPHTVSLSLIRRLQAYSHALDVLAPAVFQRRERSFLGIENANHGVIYIDIRGQGNRNRAELALTLARVDEDHRNRTRGADPIAQDALVSALQLGQRRASVEFDLMLRKIRQLIRDSGLTGKLRISGDEIVLELDKPLAENDYTRFLSRLQHSGVPLRSSWIMAHEATPNGEHIVQAETMERATRNMLSQLRHDHHFLSELTINVKLEIKKMPDGTKAKTLNLFLSHPSNKAQLQRARAGILRLLKQPRYRDVMVPAGHVVGSVNVID